MSYLTSLKFPSFFFHFICIWRWARKISKDATWTSDSSSKLKSSKLLGGKVLFCIFHNFYFAWRKVRDEFATQIICHYAFVKMCFHFTCVPAIYLFLVFAFVYLFLRFSWDFDLCIMYKRFSLLAHQHNLS